MRFIIYRDGFIFFSSWMAFVTKSWDKGESFKCHGY